LFVNFHVLRLLFVYQGAFYNAWKKIGKDACERRGVLEKALGKQKSLIF